MSIGLKQFNLVRINSSNRNITTLFFSLTLERLFPCLVLYCFILFLKPYSYVSIKSKNHYVKFRSIL